MVSVTLQATCGPERDGSTCGEEPGGRAYSSSKFLLLVVLMIFLDSPWVCVLEMGTSESVWWRAVAGVEEG